MLKKTYNPTIRKRSSQSKKISKKGNRSIRNLPKLKKINVPSPNPTCYCPMCGEELDYMKPIEICSNCRYRIGVPNQEDGSLEWSPEMTQRIPIPKDWYNQGQNPSSDMVEGYSRGFLEGIRFHWRKYLKIGNPSERRY